MANIVNQVIVSEGTKKAIVQFYFESDGNEGEFKNKVIFDPSTDFLVPYPLPIDPNSITKYPAPKVTILQIWSSASWFDMTIAYGGATIVPSVVVARDADFYLDFRYFGGLKDRTTDVPTGQILLSTKDFAPLGSNGFLVLELKKD